MAVKEFDRWGQHGYAPKPVKYSPGTKVRIDMHNGDFLRGIVCEKDYLPPNDSGSTRVWLSLDIGPETHYSLVCFDGDLSLSEEKVIL